MLPGLTFEFFRLRFHLRALDPLRFPRHKAANTLRGALLERLQAGHAASPPASGFAHPAGPFVLRASHLNGQSFAPGEVLSFDLHHFDIRRPALNDLREALACFATGGIGPGRGCAELLCAEQIDFAGTPATTPCVIHLDPEPSTVTHALVQFATPTELKNENGLSAKPEFCVLIARLRDRLSTLRALYGAGPLPLEFRATAERAAAVRITRCELAWQHVNRRSSRTGQIHSIGGFTGHVEYDGPLGEFLPWLRAACWTGVGRQTAWGKGEVRVISYSG